MRTTSVKCLAILVVVYAGLSLRGGHTQEKANKVRIEGFVFNSERKPLTGVDVTVWVAGRTDAISSARSDKDGKYELDVVVSEPYDVSYTMTKYRLAVVTFLADQRSQQISRVLYARGEKMPASAAHAHAQAVDRAVFLATALQPGQRRIFLKKFPDFIDGPAVDLELDPEVSSELKTLITGAIGAGYSKVKKLIE